MIVDLLLASGALNSFTHIDTKRRREVSKLSNRNTKKHIPAEMAKGKSSTKKVAGKKGGKKGKKSFKSYISKVNKNSKKGLTLSSKSVKILNSFVFDMFDRIATQAAAVVRANKGATINAAAIQTAVRLQLSGDLARHAVSEASKAVLGK